MSNLQSTVCNLHAAILRQLLQMRSGLDKNSSHSRDAEPASFYVTLRSFMHSAHRKSHPCRCQQPTSLAFPFFLPAATSITRIRPVTSCKTLR